MAVLGLEKSGKESAVSTKTTNTNTNMESEFNESKAGMSVASLACAICGPLLLCTGMGWILSVIAVVLGILCYKTKQGIKGVATAGIILGIVTGIPMFIMSVVISGFLTMLGMAAA